MTLVTLSSLLAKSLLSSLLVTLLNLFLNPEIDSCVRLRYLYLSKSNKKIRVLGSCVLDYSIFNLSSTYFLCRTGGFLSVISIVLLQELLSRSSCQTSLQFVTSLSNSTIQFLMCYLYISAL